MLNPVGESDRQPLRPVFDRRLKLEVHGSPVRSRLSRRFGAASATPMPPSLRPNRHRAIITVIKEALHRQSQIIGLRKHREPANPEK